MTNTKTNTAVVLAVVISIVGVYGMAKLGAHYGELSAMCLKGTDTLALINAFKECVLK
jgi:hypothetical protein